MEVINVAVKVINFISSMEKITGSSNFWPKKWERNMWDFCFMPKSVGCREANTSLDCMNLKMRLKSFFENTKATSVSYFTMKMFVVMFAYLPNVFSHLNDTKLFLQGHDVTVNDVKDKLAGLTSRMGVWQGRIKVYYIVSCVGA